MDTNAKTLDVYNRHFDRYMAGTPSEITPGDSQGEWLKDIVDTYLPDAAHVLEIGSAQGRDARWLQDAGVRVQVTDATDAAISHLKSHGFPDAAKLNILSDDIDSAYDMIFAAAVFLHFTADELRAVLGKIHGHLQPTGVLAFSVKQGEGEAWQDHKMGEARYFKFWQIKDMDDLLESTGYEVLDRRVLDDGKWVHYIAGVKHGN